MKNLNFIRTMLYISLFLTMLSIAIPTSRSFAQEDPSGTKTGNVMDVPAAKAGQPTLMEVADAVGHNRIAMNILWT